ncbi:MAG: response regulator [Caulobacterales bacterium]
MRKQANDLPLRHVGALIVDEHKQMRLIVGMLLRSLGCKDYRACAEAGAAFEALQIRPADVIIVGAHMGALEDLEFVHRLRREAASPCPNAPVLMMIGHADRWRVGPARDAGVTEFIARPLSARALCARIEAVAPRPSATVRSLSFSGPSRRRRANVTHTGPWRRASDLSAPAATASVLGGTS